MTTLFVEETHILFEDLLVLEEMSWEMEAYLLSEALQWAMTRADMPRLTVGGYLMRVQRLSALWAELTDMEQRRVKTAVERVDQLITEQTVRFESKAHAELHARLSEWVGYLRNWSHMTVKPEIYANAADTRVVIAVTMDRLQEKPLHLDPTIIRETLEVDKHLRKRWQDGAFIWNAIWQPAYPQDKYWWLYGGLKG